MAVNWASGMLESSKCACHNYLKEPDPEHSMLMLYLTAIDRSLAQSQPDL